MNKNFTSNIIIELKKIDDCGNCKHEEKNKFFCDEREEKKKQYFYNLGNGWSKDLVIARIMRLEQLKERTQEIKKSWKNDDYYNYLTNEQQILENWLDFTGGKNYE